MDDDGNYRELTSLAIILNLNTPASQDFLQAPDILPRFFFSSHDPRTHS